MSVMIKDGVKCIEIKNATHLKNVLSEYRGNHIAIIEQQKNGIKNPHFVSILPTKNLVVKLTYNDEVFDIYTLDFD